MPLVLQVGRVRLRMPRGLYFLDLLLSAVARRQTHNPVVEADEQNLDNSPSKQAFNIQNRARTLPAYHRAKKARSMFTSAGMGAFGSAVVAVLGLEFNLHDLFFPGQSAGRRCRGRQPRIAQLLWPVCILRDAISALFTKVSLTISAVFQFSFIYTAAFRRSQPDSVSFF